MRRNFLKRDKEISRRKFFSKLGIGAIISTFIGSVIITFKYLFPNVLFEPSASFKVGSPSDFPIGSSVFLKERKVYLFHDIGGFHTISAICPHLGCLLTKQPQGGFLCPCHGSIFDKKGNVLKKPANRRLDSYKVSLARDGKVLIDLSEKVDENFRLKV